MKFKQISSGVAQIKQLNTGPLVMGIIGVVIGLVLFIMSFFPQNTQPEWYIGVLLFLGGVVILLFWKSRNTTFDKNQNIMIYKEKRLTKNQQKKVSLKEIKNLTYQERMSYSARGRSGSRMRITKIVNINTKTGESYTIYRHTSGHNPFFNLTKSSAQKLADFLEVELQIISQGGMINNMFNKVTGQNQNGQI